MTNNEEVSQYDNCWLVWFKEPFPREMFELWEWTQDSNRAIYYLCFAGLLVKGYYVS